ncbi:Putative translation initiation inhibitor, yjgF family [Rubellimicrobium thermophilum DSM 16684]|uniref:Putative translation initiation inhibitor, yjgF family n=1 Tax=Rubellimicrobium thermophilum DSM 16684 TaxID=1123069 RepID=S9SI98_9RHOB|nr:RidA family protein [Rubellimicrobium thermophilum]EPX86059.1 Putative translation initiation inhibitor, yjgF family [Rubellimicrobium thermophilum DSM 16684]
MTQSQSITRIEPGPRMSQAVLHGGIVYLAGQVGAPGAPVEEQTRAVLAEIDRLLALAGTSKARLLTAQIWLADIADFAAMNAVWDQWVDPANPPARWTGEARLAAPDYRVEIIVTAAL